MMILETPMIILETIVNTMSMAKRDEAVDLIRMELGRIVNDRSVDVSSDQFGWFAFVRRRLVR